MISIHNISNVFKAAAGCVILTTVTACHHKDLYYPEPELMAHLYIHFDWQKAPQANPASMVAYLYEEDGTSPLRFIFDNKDGGEIKAPAGVRHVLFSNADNTSWVKMRHNENIETMELFTEDTQVLSAQGLDVSSLPESRDGSAERIASTPQMLWGGRSNGHVISPDSVTQTITLYPDELICYYTVDILDVQNLEGVVSAKVDGTLSGMADGYSLGGVAPTDSVVTMPFTLVADTARQSLHSEYLTFGECPHLSQTHILTVYMILSDGSRWCYTYDVTRQVTDAPDPRHVHIVVSGLPLPEPPGQHGNSGLSPDVNEWQVVHITLPM